MANKNIHPFEDQRLEALSQLNILDSQQEVQFDELTRLASIVCQAPIAAVVFVDKDRLWFKSATGIVKSNSQMPRELSFCSYGILQNEPLIVEDARNDERFKNHDSVIGPMNCAFYVGFLIVDPKHNMPVGTFCVIDNKPRKLSDQQIDTLAIIRNQIQTLLALRTQQNYAKKIESELNETLHRQNLVLEGAEIGAWDWWPQTGKVHFDDRWCRMIGLNYLTTVQDFTTWESRIHLDDKQQAFKDVESHAKGETSVYENIHRLRHENGHWVWILARGKISQFDDEGRPVRFSGTHLEITNRKRDEFLSNEIQKIAQIGGWELDVASGRTKWTEQTYRIHAIENNTPTDKIMGIDFYAAHERERIKRCVEGCVAGKSYRETFEFIDAKGVQKWVEASGVPIADSTGRIISLVGTFQDVTEKIVGDQKLEVARLNAAHASRLASLGEISAGVAHEINNPLAIISSAISLMAKYLKDDSKYTKKIESINSAVTRIAKIVNGLKKFSRSNDQADRNPAFIAEILRESIELISPKAKRDTVSIDISSKTESQILCDVLEIEQVIVNLVNNAIDAAKDTPGKWVKVRLFDQNEKIVLQIEDSGPGLTKEVEAKLFQPFFTTKPVGEGTGLGLSICKGILDQHSAEIYFNKNFKNTCFEVVFEKLN